MGNLAPSFSEQFEAQGMFVCDLSITSEIFQESGFVQRKIHSPDQRVPKHSKQTFCLKQRRRKRIIKNKNSQTKNF